MEHKGKESMRAGKKSMEGRSTQGREKLSKGKRYWMLGREITVSGTNPERLCVLYIHRNREAKRFLEGGPRTQCRRTCRISIPHLGHHKEDYMFCRVRATSDEAPGK